MADPQTRKLARQLVRMDERLKHLETVPQMAHSSIDDRGLPVYDADGNLVAKVGKQDDGTWGAPPLAGPIPPTPVGISAVGGPGSVTVSWTGEYERAAAPLDFDTLEVLIDGALAGAIPNRDGGTVTISAAQGSRYISARIRTLVPRHSATTSPFAVEVGPPADQLFIDAKEEIDAAQDAIDQAKQDILDEREARERALQEAAQELAILDGKLADRPSLAELDAVRVQVAAAQEAVEAAQTVAQEANTAANAASQAALEAAGIAASKGRVIVSETEPQGEDRKSSNIWIQPVPDDPETEVEEKAVTYVYLEASDEWQPTTSSELAQAAQNALDAREAAQQAQQRADTAIANASKAQGAAEAAQRTADQATLDARGAHNEAVAAQEELDNLKIGSVNLFDNGDFRHGRRAPAWISTPPLKSEGGRTYAQIGDGWALRYSLPLSPGDYVFSLDVRDPSGTESSVARVNIAFKREDGSTLGTVNPFESLGGKSGWQRLAYNFTVPEGAVGITGYVLNGDSAGNALLDFSYVKVEEGNRATSWSPSLADQQAAVDAAWARADEAYTEAASKATPEQAQGYAQAAEEAAKADATAKVEAAEARAAQEALRIAKAEAEREAGEAEAAAKAYADLIDTGASEADIEAAKRYAEEQAEQARIAAERAAPADATAKAEQAEANAAADAKTKADKALADAKADATAKASAAEKAAKAAAAADAKAKADAAEAAAKKAAAADAKAKADAAQAAAEAAANAVAKSEAGAARTAAEAEAKRLASLAEQAAKAAAAADATAKADQAKADAAADAKAKADKALQDALAALATARGEITAEIKASANGKNSITRKTIPPNVDGVVEGDEWNQVDDNGDAFANWKWNGSRWVPSKILNSMLESLDVHKLQVTGSAKIAEAVVDKLFADVFAAHKITARELSIGAVGPDGELVPGTVRGVHIGDGQVSANKLLIDGDPENPDEVGLVARIASIMRLAVENLVVTDGATIDEAVILKLAAEMITSGVLRTAETGQRVVIDQGGVVMYGLDDNGDEYELVRLGPSGENLLTIDDTTVAPDGIATPSLEAGEVAVNGRAVADMIADAAQGTIAWAYATHSTAWDGSSTEHRRMEISATLLPNRRYSITMDHRWARVRGTGTVRLVERLRYSTVGDSQATSSWGQLAVMGTILADTRQSQTVPQLVGILDTADLNLSEPTQVWFRWTTQGPGSKDYRIEGSPGEAIRLTLRDEGPSVSSSGMSWFDIGTAVEGATEAPPPAVEKVTRTERFAATRAESWDRGASSFLSGKSGTVYQGKYPGVSAREGAWWFPALNGNLSGAKVKRVQLRFYVTHTYWGAGGTATVRLHGKTGFTTGGLDTPIRTLKVKRNAWYSVDVPAAYLDDFRTGKWRGFGLSSSSTDLEYYVQARLAGAEIRITYEK